MTIISADLAKKMDELAKNEIVDRHSYFQLKYFVIGKEPTTQAKLWRCLRELQSRRQSIEAMTLEIDEIKDNIELLKIKNPTVRSDAFGITETPETEQVDRVHRRKAFRKIRSAERQLQDVEKKLKYTEEEADFFIKAFESLKKVEPLKPYDDLESQTNYWNEKLTQEIHMRMLLSLPMDTELVKTALSLDKEVPITKNVVHLLENMKTEKKLEGNK